MPRIALKNVDDMDQRRRAQYERFPSNLTRTLTLMDSRLAEALPEVANALRGSTLDPALREAAILRVAAASGSAYERMQHLGQARAVGWSDQAIAAIEGPEPGRRPRELVDVLRFVDALLAGTIVDDEILAGARTRLTDPDLVTMIVLVGHYMTVARLTVVLDIDLDARPDRWTHEH